MSSFTSHGGDINVPETLLALMMLNGARVSDNQKLRIFPAAVTSIEDDDSEISKLFKQENQFLLSSDQDDTTIPPKGNK